MSAQTSPGTDPSAKFGFIDVRQSRAEAMDRQLDERPPPRDSGFRQRASTQVRSSASSIRGDRGPRRWTGNSSDLTQRRIVFDDTPSRRAASSIRINRPEDSSTDMRKLTSFLGTPFSEAISGQPLPRGQERIEAVSGARSRFPCALGQSRRTPRRPLSAFEGVREAAA